MAEEANSGVQDAAAFCGDCGAQSNGASFCQHCGKRLKRPAVSVGTRPVPGAEAVASPQVARGASQNGHPTPAAPVGELPTMPVTTYEAYPTPPGGTRAQPSAANDIRLPGPPELSAPPTVYMAPKNRSNRGWLIAGVVIGVIAIAGAAIAIVLALSKKTQEPTYSQQVTQIVRPLLADNQKLAVAVQGLTPISSSGTTRFILTITQSQLQTSQQQLTNLQTGAANSSLSAQVNAALSAEGQWLQNASAVLATPSSPLVSQLSGLGLDAQTKLRALGASIPAAIGSTFPSSTQIVTYVSAVNANAQANAADTQFSNQVMALLNQSTPVFQQINSFYEQLQSAANGDGATITLAQAEQQIEGIVASRTSLAAAAQALNAATPATQAVEPLLVTAFNDSLRDDNDLASCLNEANDGSEAFIFQSCLSSTTGDSSTATTDKQAFLAAYNQLRSSIGQPSVNPQF